jgi:hypothetical protein
MQLETQLIEMGRFRNKATWNGDEGQQVEGTGNVSERERVGGMR